MNYWGEDYDHKFKNLEKRQKERENKRDPKKKNQYVIPRKSKDEDD